MPNQLNGENDGLGPGWTPVETPPIVPGQNAHIPPPTKIPYAPTVVGTIPASFQLPTDLAKSEYGGILPTIRIIPVQASGQPGTNSGVLSATNDIAETANTAQATANTALATAITAAGNAFVGSWNTGVQYGVGNQVTLNSNYYTCISQNESSGANEPGTSGGAAYWQLVSSASTETFLGAWSSATAYVAGNQVTENGSYYIAIANSTNEQPPNSTYWTLVGTSALFIGAWSSSTPYQVGSQVTYNGAFFTCIQANTNELPTNGSYWQIVATASAFLGAWSSATGYLVNQEVSYQGNLYVCITANTNETPTNATYWTLVGPQNSVQVVGSPSFTVSSTSSSVTISWSGFTIYLPNGETIAVSASSQTISSLSASTTYYLFPFYNYSTQTIEFVDSADVTLPNLAGVRTTGSGYIATTTSITPNTSTSHYSVELWVYPTANSGNLISLGAGGPAIQLDSASSGAYTLSVTPSTGSSGAVNGGVLTSNFWNHVVVVLDYGGGAGGTCQITVYLNGVQVNNTTSNPASISASKWIIAANSTDGGQGTAPSGTFARVAVYGTTLLTATQVLNHYNAMLQTGPTGFDTLVVADGATYYWKLNETSGTSAADSVDSNTGTYTGTYTLNNSEAIGGANGSPADAWQNPPLAVTLAQYLQSQIPLSAGGVVATTTSSGSSGGSIDGGFYAPSLPQGLFT